MSKSQYHVFIALIVLGVLLILSACGDVVYKQTTSGGGELFLDDRDGLVVEAQDDARVIAGSNNEGDQREEIGGIPVEPVGQVESAAVTRDVCLDGDGNAVSGPTCEARFVSDN